MSGESKIASSDTCERRLWRTEQRAMRWGRLNQQAVKFDYQIRSWTGLTIHFCSGSGVGERRSKRVQETVESQCRFGLGIRDRRHCRGRLCVGNARAGLAAHPCAIEFRLAAAARHRFGFAAPTASRYLSVPPRSVVAAKQLHRTTRANAAGTGECAAKEHNDGAPHNRHRLPFGLEWHGTSILRLFR